MTFGRWSGALTLALALSCAKKPPPPHRTEPWLARPSVGPAPSAPSQLVFHFGGESHVSFSVAGTKGKLSGRAPVIGGSLRFDPRDLQSARGDVDVDLTRARLDDVVAVPSAVTLAAAPDQLLQQWLELGAEVPAERRASFGKARFELVSVESPSPSFLELSRGHRTRLTAVGTLLIHGFKEPVRADVTLTSSGDGSAPPRLSIQSAAPLVVTLGPHEITARDAAGIPDALGLLRSADFVGKTVRLSVELTAAADPTGN